MIRTRTLATLALPILAAAACTTSKAGNPQESTDPTSRPVTAAPDACAKLPLPRDGEFCQDLTFDGTTYRYALVRADPASTSTVLVDPGGPGISALAGPGPFRIAEPLGPELDINMLVIEEPWVTATLPDGCSEALTDLYRTVTEEHRIDPGSLAERCPLAQAGLPLDRYGALLDAIEDAEEIDVDAFYGSSFAAVRWAAADPDRFTWTVLNRPYPLGVDGAALTAARADLLDDALRQVEADIPDRPRLDTLVGAQLDERSLPISVLDVVSARVAAGGSGIPPDGPGDVATLSDQLWGRYGERELSGSVLAYWAEVCAATGGFDQGGWDGTPQDLRGFLTMFHQPCSHVPSVPLAPGGDQPVCVVVADGDAVAPVALSEAAFTAADATIIRSADGRHDSTDGVAACLAQVRGDPERGAP